MPLVAPYEALLLLSFGGPEESADVLPFLRNVTSGRSIPPERLAAVAEHYLHFGGRSPINDQNRALQAALVADLSRNDVQLPVYWGNRNWDPFAADALRHMRRDRISRAAVFVTSAFASYSGCRQYREDLAKAAAEVEADGQGPVPRLDKLRHYFDHPGFVAANADALVSALSSLDAATSSRSAPPRVVFVTHSIPVSMAERSGPAGGEYVRQHRAAAAAVIRVVRERTGQIPGWELAYCSRSGPAQVPWLGPDVNDRIVALGESGASGVILAPIGFVSDHMEVVYDLDTEAAQTAQRVGLPMVRAATAGVHPDFVAAIRDLLLERAAVERRERPARAASSPIGPSHDTCPAGCCPNPAGPRSALCGAD